ncbi:hypothetical protein H4R33_001783 [Dimargaris cristalligena]|uniref:Mitochondrial ribosomal protein subunit L20-domain-containing protein n=1 Tax=Dimargaris cristalligena TaxID=215637 RepID=A0A4P9ZWV7_9FUNG|nr:hypothetical protein H4R33_001783 [Dimargaris cristalligena]RKP38113.1 mitochondrial ribosomal protein subunit L20-domain-containing protein [Dimargaris cristalligena]|eukprot:RKP38113.1 mitochondrial ribosomal protein subunit L20-domain-containing protein [Dimargaris cristalligena]
MALLTSSKVGLQSVAGWGARFMHTSRPCGFQASVPVQRRTRRDNHPDRMLTLPSIVSPMPTSPPASATVHARIPLDDGSEFIARVPLDAAALGPLAETDLPPPLYPRREPKPPLSAEQQAEVRQLRNDDPVQWTSKRLALKFDCDPVHISRIAPAPRSHIKNMIAKAELEWDQLGWKRRLIAINRVKRRALW